MDSNTSDHRTRKAMLNWLIWLGILIAIILFSKRWSAAEQTNVDEAALKKLYKYEPGEHEVIIKDVTLHDEKRDKDLPVRVRMPKGEGKYPLIIHSHGAGGSRTGGGPLVDHWVSHGYIVIQPTHGDSISLLSRQEKIKAAMNLKRYVNSRAVSDQWDDRPRDVIFLLDHLDELAKKVDGLDERMDRDKMAHSGHSFGAHTCMVLAGMKLFSPDMKDSITISDSRFKCFIAFSPQGTGKAIHKESYEAMTRPMLFITGDKDGTPIKGRENKTGTWRREAYDHAGCSEKFLLWIKDAQHNFGGMNGHGRKLGDQNPTHVAYVRTTSLAFWDALLKEDADAREYLEKNQIAEVTGNDARIEQKRAEEQVQDVEE